MAWARLGLRLTVLVVACSVTLTGCTSRETYTVDRRGETHDRSTEGTDSHRVHEAPRLVALDSNLEPFRTRFNSAAKKHGILAVLSPT